MAQYMTDPQPSDQNMGMMGQQPGGQPQEMDYLNQLRSRYSGGYNTGQGMNGPMGSGGGGLSSPNYTQQGQLQSGPVPWTSPTNSYLDTPALNPQTPQQAGLGEPPGMNQPWNKAQPQGGPPAPLPPMGGPGGQTGLPQTGGPQGPGRTMEWFDDPKQQDAWVQSQIAAGKPLPGFVTNAQSMQDYYDRYFLIANQGKNAGTSYNQAGEAIGLRPNTNLANGQINFADPANIGYKAFLKNVYAPAGGQRPFAELSGDLTPGTPAYNDAFGGKYGWKQVFSQPEQDYSTTLAAAYKLGQADPNTDYHVYQEGNSWNIAARPQHGAAANQQPQPQAGGSTYKAGGGGGTSYKASGSGGGGESNPKPSFSQGEAQTVGRVAGAAQGVLGALQPGSLKPAPAGTPWMGGANQKPQPQGPMPWQQGVQNYVNQIQQQLASRGINPNNAGALNWAAQLSQQLANQAVSNQSKPVYNSETPQQQYDAYYGYR